MNMEQIQADWPEICLNTYKKIVDVEPLHTKLNLMKNFVEGINRKDQAFKYFRENFPR